MIRVMSFLLGIHKRAEDHQCAKQAGKGVKSQNVRGVGVARSVPGRVPLRALLMASELVSLANSDAVISPVDNLVTAAANCKWKPYSVSGQPLQGTAWK